MSGSKRTGVVVQMRLDSTRLPGKALLPLGGTTLAGMVLRRLRGIAADELILATDAAGARALGKTAAEFGFSVFAGPKDDVLARYMMAADAFRLYRIVRATGDNPFVSVELGSLAIELAEGSDADYLGLVGMPVGMGVEVIAVDALRVSAARATDPFDREHVCPYLYTHPDEFIVSRPDCPLEYRYPEGRLTIDTDADFRRARAIVLDLGSEPSDATVMAWLRAERKDG